jgi:transposase InsO family protein
MIRTTVQQRLAFCSLHVHDAVTYRQIAGRYDVSPECVRYWCRRQRKGASLVTSYHHPGAGLLSHFDPLVRYWVIRLRLKHPRWGPKPILYHLGKHLNGRVAMLPSCAAIGRYLHQWPSFRRQPRHITPRQRPCQPTGVHQRWQFDFKLGVVLDDHTRVTLHTVRDAVGEACLAVRLYPAGRTGTSVPKVTAQEARATLRWCFAQWHTLPDEVQTDGEGALVGQPGDPFPSAFTLWLRGLGIAHLVTRPGTPTDNAEVERCQRTVTDYAIIGNEWANRETLQGIVDQAVHELAFEIPSAADGCHGRTPVEAHPELLHPRHVFPPGGENDLFDLRRVDAYLATLSWQRMVGKTGQVSIGGQHHYYSVGRRYAHHIVTVRFDPQDRSFVFYDAGDLGQAMGRQPARDLEVADITGWSESVPADAGDQADPAITVGQGVSC